MSRRRRSWNGCSVERWPGLPEHGSGVKGSWMTGGASLAAWPPEAPAGAEVARATVAVDTARKNVRSTDGEEWIADVLVLAAGVGLPQGPPPNY